jgi:hypothetical protein
MSATFNADEDDDVVDGGHFVVLHDGVTSFLVAGAVLFASLVLGSAIALFFAGSDATMAAILRGFLSLGFRALGGFLVAVLVALAIAALRRPRDA